MNTFRTFFVLEQRVILIYKDRLFQAVLFPYNAGSLRFSYPTKNACNYAGQLSPSTRRGTIAFRRDHVIGFLQKAVL